MICEIPTLKVAKEIMDAALEVHGTLKFDLFHPLIFDLDESIDPNEVETKIIECMTCDLMIHSTLGVDEIDHCPRCGEDHLKTMVDVLLVIQGLVVMYTSWRKP
jgi:hypothetical protein